MAIHHLTVTLNGAAQPLSATSTNCKEIQIQGESGGALFAVGGSAVTVTDYGQLVAATVVLPVIIRPSEGTANLNSTYVIGTNGNKIHVLYITP